MPNWPSTFTNNPPNTQSPSLGDDAIRDTRMAVEERAVNEHSTHEDGTTGTALKDWLHKPGSARVFVGDYSADWSTAPTTFLDGTAFTDAAIGPFAIGSIAINTNAGALYEVRVLTDNDPATWTPFGLTSNGVFAKDTDTVAPSVQAVKEYLQLNSGGTRILKTSGTAASWTKPAGVVKFFVLLVAGGGGAGYRDDGVPDGSGGAGGGGQIAWEFVTCDPAEDTATYTVGAGGTGGQWGVYSTTSGGNTTFKFPHDTGATYIAHGGSAAPDDSHHPGAGGTGATGTTYSSDGAAGGYGSANYLDAVGGAGGAAGNYGTNTAFNNERLDGYGVGGAGATVAKGGDGAGGKIAIWY